MEQEHFYIWKIHHHTKKTCAFSMVCEQKIKAGESGHLCPLSIALNLFDAWKCKQSQLPLA